MDQWLKDDFILKENLWINKKSKDYFLVIVIVVFMNSPKNRTGTKSSMGPVVSIVIMVLKINP